MQWLYQKKELPEEHQHDFIADDIELFPTNHYQNVYVQSINARCTVYNSVQEFEAVPLAPDVFYTRANYDMRKKQFRPEESKWESCCSCQKPTNPTQ